MSARPAPHEDRDHRFALLEARHIDKLTESVVTLNRNVVALTEIGRKQLASNEKLCRLLEAAGATTVNGDAKPKAHGASSPSEAEYEAEARNTGKATPNVERRKAKR